MGHTSALNRVYGLGSPSAAIAAVTLPRNGSSLAHRLIVA
jgi:hypothetical protein